MPRKPNLWFPGAKYHIINRGIRRNPLFEDDDDYYQYLSLLTEAKGKFPFSIQSYCLMTNHTHIQIQTIDTSPDKFMHFLNLRYAKYFNKKYSYTGHVFEKRYAYELVDSIEYEIELSKYIHLNPLKAGIVHKLEDYPWSSYRAYSLYEKNDLVSNETILSYFHDPKSLHYDQYMKAENITSVLKNLNLNLVGNPPL